MLRVNPDYYWAEIRLLRIRGQWTFKVGGYGGLQGSRRMRTKTLLFGTI